MEIHAKGAFKFASARACAAALREYEAAGYGVLSERDWKVAGAYAFIATTVEPDVDMVSWRESFEDVAGAAQEGELDLEQDGEGGFARLVKTKGKKKLAITHETTGFGDPYAARTEAWSRAVEKIQKAEAKAKAEKERALAHARALAERACVATYELGGYGLVLAEADGSVSAIANGEYLRALGAEIVQRVPTPGVTNLQSIARIDAETLVAWSPWAPKIHVLRGETWSVRALAEREGAPARPEDVLALGPGLLAVREERSVRVVDVERGETRALPLGEVSGFTEAFSEWPRRRGAIQRHRGVAFEHGVAFASVSRDQNEVLLLGPSQEHRVALPRPLYTLAAVDGALFALVEEEEYRSATLHPVSRDGLGEPCLEVSLSEPVATPIDGERWVFCGGFESVHAVPSGMYRCRHGGGFVAKVADVADDGRVALASLSYDGRVDVLQDGYVRWTADARARLDGARWVGEHLIAWSGSSAALHLLREGEPAQRLLAHERSVSSVIAIDGSRFASLDAAGGLRLWDLASLA